MNFIDDDEVPTRIELQNRDGIYSIEVNQNVEVIDDLRDFVLEPLLMAMGFSEQLVQELFGNAEDVIVPSIWDIESVNDDTAGEPFVVTTTTNTAGKPFTIDTSARIQSGRIDEGRIKFDDVYPPLPIGVGSKFISQGDNPYELPEGLVYELIEDEFGIGLVRDDDIWAGSYEVAEANDLSYEEIDQIFDGDYKYFKRHTGRT